MHPFRQDCSDGPVPGTATGLTRATAKSRASRPLAHSVLTINLYGIHAWFLKDLAIRWVRNCTRHV